MFKIQFASHLTQKKYNTNAFVLALNTSCDQDLNQLLKNSEWNQWFSRVSLCPNQCHQWWVNISAHRCIWTELTYASDVFDLSERSAHMYEQALQRCTVILCNMRAGICAKSNVKQCESAGLVYWLPILQQNMFPVDMRNTVVCFVRHFSVGRWFWCYWNPTAPKNI